MSDEIKYYVESDGHIVEVTKDNYTSLLFLYNDLYGYVLQESTIDGIVLKRPS